MTVLTDYDSYRPLLAEMMANGRATALILPCDFSREWMRQRNWTVVPVEPGNGHFGELVRKRLAAVLLNSGIDQLVALATEPLGDLPHAYALKASPQELQRFDAELGLFRFVVTDDAKHFAISCTEWYNLYAARSDLLADLLGTSIREARRNFRDYAEALAGNPDDRILAIADWFSDVP